MSRQRNRAAARVRIAGILLMAPALACAAAAQQDTAVAPGEEGLPPAGFGTLRQDDVALRLATPTLEIQLVPLYEGVLRLLAPDTYGSLHRLRESKADQIAAATARYGVRAPMLFLVTFFARQDQARFTPEVLTVTSENRLFRPVAIVPLSPLWGGQLLNQRETAMAIYVFDEGIRLFDPLAVSYDGFRTDAWTRIIRTLDRERASVLARAAARKEP